MTRQIKLNLGNRSYSIHVGKGLLSQSGALLLNFSSAKTFAILSTAVVFRHYGKGLLESLWGSGFLVHSILVPDGESRKNEKTLFLILRKMATLELKRDSGLIVLGGGVLGDLGGLAASLYMRGIDFIQCPTTLLAQVDASVGGKTAIDFSGIKNLIGTFYQPKLVIADTEVLKTLGERQYKSGLAEIVKYGVIWDEQLFAMMEKKYPNILRRESGVLKDLVRRSCEIKAEIVSRDEREAGKRAWLNYGHTLGHALEAYWGYKILTHGEAVAYGMWFASMLSAKLKMCSESTVDRQRKLLKNLDIIRRLPRFNPQKVYRKMMLDKKTRRGGIQFILTRKIGLVNIRKYIPKSLILSALVQFQAEACKTSREN